MLSLRAKLLLFLLPIIIGSLISALSMMSMIEHWHRLSHPEWWIGGLIVAFSVMITWAVWFVLHNVTSSLEYVGHVMNTACLATPHEKAPIKQFSDVYEIRDILEAAEQMKIDLSRARIELLENTKLAEIGNDTAKVLHDMASPMTVLNMALAQLQLHAEKHPEVLASLNILDHVSQRIRALYDDLLAQYRGEPMKIDSFSLPELLDDVEKSLKNTVIGKSSSWKREDAAGLLLVKGSRNLLHRAVCNIVKNGLEALYNTPEMLGQREVSLITELLDNHYYEIRLHDNGPGIPEASQVAILEGGFTEGKKDGHGLGMKVARQAVEFHGGHMSVRSCKENGTTFVLRLPIEGVSLNKRSEYEHNAVIQNFVGVESISAEINQRVQPDLLMQKVIDLPGLVVH